MKYNLRICYTIIAFLNLFSISIMFILCLLLFAQNVTATEWYKDKNYNNTSQFSSLSTGPMCLAGQKHTWDNCFGHTVISDSDNSPYIGQYVGNFKNGKPDGLGILVEPSGDTYVGNFKNGKPDGLGAIDAEDGTRIIGELYDNGQLKKGLGYAYLSESGFKFYGDLFNELNQDRGNGLLIYPDGSTYAGELFDGDPHGQGILTQNNHKYIGEFRNGNRHGQGTHFWPKGNKYVGEFKDDKQHGLGAFYFNDKDLPELRGAVYRGENYEGVFHGFGSLTFPNGDQYIGNFEKNSIKGLGKYIYIDGRIIEDNFEVGDVLRLNRNSNHNKVDRDSIKREKEDRACYAGKSLDV